MGRTKDLAIDMEYDALCAEKLSEYYAHNHFDMHETNNYKALKQGFEAGFKEAMLFIRKISDFHTK
jgi:plasmid replication initiation protein